MNTPFVELHAKPGSASFTSPSSEHDVETSLLEDSETITISRFLSPNGNKLYDFRNEPGFAEIAQKTISERRTLLDFNRLLTLFQSVRNTQDIGCSVAEIGAYKGGSSKFLARCYAHFDKNPPIHVFDTFTGHPDVLVSTLDGKHKPGLFSDTDAAAVKDYLSEFKNIDVHVGSIEERCSDVKEERFSLVHIDVDIYSATVTCLNFFAPRLVEGGIIVVDDYGFSTCIGAKQAVDYFLSVTENFYGFYVHTGQFVLQKRGFDSEAIARNGLRPDQRLYALEGRLIEQQQMMQSLQSQLIEKTVLLETTKNLHEQDRRQLEGDFLAKVDLLEDQTTLLKIEVEEQKAVIAELNGYLSRFTNSLFWRLARGIRKSWTGVN